MSQFVRCIVVVACATGCACSALLGSDDISGTDAGIATEAGPSDAAATGDATESPADAQLDDARLGDAGDAAGTLPLVNPGFELAGCAGWAPYLGTGEPDTTARSGNGSCRICQDPGAGTDTFTQFGQVVSGAFPGGKTYVVEAYVRAAPAKTAVSSVSVRLRFSYDGSATDTPEGIVNPTGDWKPLSTAGVAPATVDSIGITFGAAPSVSGCYLLDDVVLRQVE